MIEPGVIEIVVCVLFVALAMAFHSKEHPLAAHIMTFIAAMYATIAIHLSGADLLLLQVMQNFQSLVVALAR